MLPNEILVAIFVLLEPTTLTLLARASRRFNAVAEYILYSSIAITDVYSERDHLPQRTICWCEAMLNRLHLAESVKRLQIRWTTQAQLPPSPLLLTVCDQMSLAIRALTGLEHLELSLGPANSVPGLQENMHAIERATYCCVLPSLRFCSLNADYTKGIQPYTTHLITFLSHTPSLRHLGLSDHHSFLNLPPPPQALPYLQYFCGSAATAASLLPGRPVHYLSLIGRDSDVSQENLFRMTRTTTPLRFLDLSAISARPVLLRNISAHLHTLERLRIRLALRHTLHYALSGIVSVACTFFANSKNIYAWLHFADYLYPLQNLESACGSLLRSRCIPESRLS